MEAERIREVFSAFGPVRVRRMFGGIGVYADDLIFALVVDGELFLKADAQTSADFRAEGCAPFAYGTKKGRIAVMSYWRAPERLLDDPDEMAHWARRALVVAQTAVVTKPKSAGASTAKRRATHPAISDGDA